MKNSDVLGAGTFGVAVAMMLSGCSSFVPSSTARVHSTTAVTTHRSSVRNVSTMNNTKQTNPLFDTSITLLNGQKVTTTHSARWKDLLVSLQIQSLPSHPPLYMEIVGNHSTVLNHSTIRTPVGPVTLVLNERMQPAAARASAPTYEYWAIAYGSQYAYCIDAVIVGKRENAKSEIMEVVRHWHVPH